METSAAADIGRIAPTTLDAVNDTPLNEFPFVVLASFNHAERRGIPGNCVGGP